MSLSPVSNPTASSQGPVDSIAVPSIEDDDQPMDTGLLSPKTPAVSTVTEVEMASPDPDPEPYTPPHLTEHSPGFSVVEQEL